LNEDALKLTMYFGERDRSGDRFTADALLEAFERRAFRTSVLLRGIEGFGIKHRLQTHRLLTLSEDLPIVAVAVDGRPRIEAALPEVLELAGHGVVTLERSRLLAGHVSPTMLPERIDEQTKLTIYCGRQERIGRHPAFVALVDLLHAHGIAGATALLGVDGTANGIRRRARFFSRNAEVPLMIICVGDGAAIARVLPAVAERMHEPLLTLERVQVCKRDGELLSRPHEMDVRDEAGLARWRKLMVYSGEAARHKGRPVYVELVRRLRAAGAAGATTLRGIWGYHGDHPPHGDKLLAIRRHVPTVTIVVDAPERIDDWFDIVDELTDERGLVTSEIVPALRATAPDVVHGGLRLADPHDPPVARRSHPR
jgi:PII-like signaling protein